MAQISILRGEARLHGISLLCHHCLPSPPEARESSCRNCLSESQAFNLSSVNSSHPLTQAHSLEADVWLNINREISPKCFGCSGKWWNSSKRGSRKSGGWQGEGHELHTVLAKGRSSLEGIIDRTINWPHQGNFLTHRRTTEFREVGHLPTAPSSFFSSCSTSPKKKSQRMV